MSAIDEGVYEINNLQVQVSLLQQAVTKLSNYQIDLSAQIDRLANVKVDVIVGEVLKELNRTEKSDASTFEDLLISNAKMAMKKQNKG